MKKLLVWDGDESLWNGIIIEDGVDAVQLPEGRYELCEELFSRGVVQSVVSFNTLADVETVLHRFGLSNFFLIPQAEFGGRSKAEMISTVKDRLGLAKYSDVVFVDDNVHNCMEVEALLPGVTTSHPGHIDHIVTTCFTKDSYTAEDRNRVGMYRAELLREESGKSFGADRLAFLHSLNLHARIFKPSEKHMPRVISLVERANRLAAKNPAIVDPCRGWQLLESDASGLWVLDAADDYGEYGISGVLLCNDATIDLLVISCRLQGKGLGSAFLGTIINQHVGRTIKAIWEQTEYNAGVKSLYEWYGFAFEETSSIVTATKHVADPVTLPDWIIMEDAYGI